MTLLATEDFFENVGLTSCASACVKSKNACRTFFYSKTFRNCTLGSWLLPYNGSTNWSSGKLYTNQSLCYLTEMPAYPAKVDTSSCINAACLGKVTLGNNTSFDRSKTYRSCLDVKNTTEPRKVVLLTSGLTVMCDTVTDGGGWTIFQRRFSGAVDFYRSWEEYKYGFGDYGIGTFYLGNENIYCLSSTSRHELRIDLTYNGIKYYARYASYAFFNESEGYRLTIANYTGDAGDSMSISNANSMFSTYDRDNDVDPSRHCAVRYHAGWWYKRCHYAHLNGNWGDNSYSMGLNWYNLTGDYASVDNCEMKIRPY
ncbi:ficolin-2-like [Physella acuta]|uniref:ficolin-2-like n=1 Tax=Physella acuta TaxID=109671 RepID=UPI0027DB7AAD|nr:ficolin-2-like [Physella acuta]